MATKVFLINYLNGRRVFEYENPPQYLPREGEYINLINLNNFTIFKVLKVVHRITYPCGSTVDIYVTYSQ